MPLIRKLRADETYPVDLLLLADPDKHVVQSYIHRCLCFLMEAAGEPIGGYCLLPTRPHVMEIVNISVYEPFQGKGYGKILVQDAIDRARSLNYRTVEIGTGNSSLTPLALYQKCGFRITGVDRDFFMKHYREAIFENGIRCMDMIRLQIDL